MKAPVFILSVVLFAACSQHYSMDDYNKVAKIDTHVHLNSYDTILGALAKEDNFRLLTVNVDAPGNPPVSQQERYALKQVAAFPDRVNFLASFNLQNWGKSKWREQTVSHLDSSFRNGALGIKIWKNIGMVYKDSADRFIMIDDPAFDPVIQFVISQDKTILGHLGEPKNCWLPIEKMTVNNDRNYFKDHPEYHMFLHPEFPSYEDQVNARDRFIERHPDMRFVGAHLGSLEWDVDELAKRLDKFPNMAVDVAARVPHLQYQSQTNREKIRNFMIKYADRLIYATDGGISVSSDPSSEKQQLHDAWLADWRYFATDDEMSVDAVNGKFNGLQLPREVIDNLYYNNAVRWFRMPAR